MGKAPADQWYYKDWLSDTELQLARSSSRGIWMNALCYMWQAEERGKITGTVEELAYLLRASNGDFEHFLEDIKKHKFGDVTICNNEVTLINRRMFREQKERENTRLRVRKFRSNLASNANVTPVSPSPTPSPKKENIKRKKILSDEEWKNEVLKLNPWVNWEDINREMDTWLLNHPGRQKTRQFISNWIVRKQKDKPMQMKKDFKSQQGTVGMPGWIEDAVKDGWKI